MLPPELLYCGSQRPLTYIICKAVSSGKLPYYPFVSQVKQMNLSVAKEGKEYTVKRIETDDEDLNAFLFSLGCYSGEPVTVVSRRKGGCTVSIKDGRYNIDNQLAEAIIV